MSLLRGLAAALACVAAFAHSATPLVSAGGGHSLALGTDGVVRSWGNDATGSLGVGRSLVSSTPVQVSGASGITKIASGSSHVIALKSDGTVIAWGENSNGQLGDGTRTNRSTPVAVSGLTGVSAITARGAHNLALKTDGSVWAWGSNGTGELGDGTYEDRLVPVRLVGMDNVAELSAGGQFTLARKQDGSVWAWGANESGQLGDGKTTPEFTGRATPVIVSGISGVIAIAAGGQHSLARKDDGSVWAWGSNSGGALGDGTTTDRLLPVPVQGLGGAVLIAAGFGHSLAIKNDLTAAGWGSNGYSELGDDTYVDRVLPVPLTGLSGTTAISTGFLHSFALVAGGNLVAWGHNELGQLGDGTTTQRGMPSAMTAITSVLAVAVGDQHTVALRNDGTVWTWGDNASGQLGNGSLVFRSTPVAVGLTGGVDKIAAGGAHSIALKADGSVFSWGDNRAGQLGDGTSMNRSAPGAVSGLGAASGVVEIAAGGLHTLARKSDGSVLSWGDNFSNALGDRSSADESVPATVIGVSGVVEIAAGADHSVALKGDGTVWTWGRNNAGQLGDGTRTDGYAGRPTPAQVAGLTGVRHIAAGSTHTVALKTDGTVWAWGDNGGGRLGDGTTIDRLRPVQVVGLSDVIAIAAGNVHTLALKRDSSVWAWGSNYSYQLGDGTGAERNTPVPVSGLTHVVAISTNSHSLALKDDGSVQAWGKNEFGPIGDGTLVDRASPVVTLRENGAGSIQGNDWFLDLDPATATTIAADKVPVFLVVASGVGSSVTANLRFRAQDVGTSGSVYVFALAPASIVRNVVADKDTLVSMKARQQGRALDTPLPCVLAQLDAAGQLNGVSSSNLQSFFSGVLGAQGQSVTILNGVANAQASGATFFVGYGASASTMLNNGTNRSVVSVPGTVNCQPQPPQTGWWWNPAEGGRGFSLEVQGNNIFLASYLYDASGRSSWYAAAGATSLEGSLFSGNLLAFAHGQTLTGTYHGPDPAVPSGAITLAFNDATHGTLIWPGGTIPIERFNIVPNGLTAAAQSNQPENGWWWNAAEGGRGYFIEWQGTGAFAAGYMYDTSGNPLWYASFATTPNTQSFQGTWTQFANGQTLTGPYKPASVVNPNVGSLAIQFQSSTTATLTLPDNRQIPITRFRF